MSQAMDLNYRRPFIMFFFSYNYTQPHSIDTITLLKNVQVSPKILTLRGRTLDVRICRL